MDKKLIENFFDFQFHHKEFCHWEIIPLLKHYCELKGSSLNDYEGFCFSAEFKKGEEDYFGENKVCFTFSEPAVETDIEIVISYEEFYEIVSKYFKEYADSNPKESEEITSLLSVLKTNLNL